MYVYQDVPDIYTYMSIICKTFVNKLTYRFVDLQGFSGSINDKIIQFLPFYNRIASVISNRVFYLDNRTTQGIKYESCNIY